MFSGSRLIVRISDQRSALTFPFAFIIITALPGDTGCVNVPRMIVLFLRTTTSCSCPWAYTEAGAAKINMNVAITSERITVGPISCPGEEKNREAFPVLPDEEGLFE